MVKKRLAAALLAAVMTFGTSVPAFAADETDAAKAGMVEKVDGTWYYHSQNGGKYTFEKVSHPDKGAGEVDGFLDEADSRSQSYSWSAIECGEYIYVGTCYNSTYGIYWRNVYQMMVKAGKTPQEAMQIARDFVQFIFNDQFDETLQPRGIVVKFNKTTGEFSAVYDSKQSDDPAIRATACSGYRMAFEFHDKLYFVSLANPTMFLLEITPDLENETETCEIAFQRSLSAEGSKKQIASGVHGLIVYDDEILMCLADESSENSVLKDEHPEGGLIIASKDARNWRIIADEDDLGPSGYHTYDGLMGGGIWDIIEYNKAVYVTVVTDITDESTGIVNKQGFALYRGVKADDGSFAWTQLAGKDKDGKDTGLPNGFGCNYSMACNMWVYDGYLYMGTYNDPMLDLAEVSARANFEPLYWDLYYSINLYRMDAQGNIELIAGRPNETFPEVKGNMGPGLGDNSNQYVWRMVNHDDKLWIATYDTSTLTSVFTQLTDGQLAGMTPEEYQNRLTQLKKLASSLGILQQKYEDIFDKVFGSEEMRKLFEGIQQLIDAGIGKNDPVPAYQKMVAEYNAFKDKITNAKVHGQFAQALYQELLKALDKTIFQPMDRIIEEMKGPVFYFGTNYYIKNATRGFDLLVSEDGVNFEVVTNDGFRDPSNHGVRTLTSADAGSALFVGTANPYYGGQMWKTVTDTPDPKPEELPDAPSKDEVIALLGETPVEVQCDNAEADPAHTAAYDLAADTFVVGTPVKKADETITVTVAVAAETYVNQFKDSFDKAVEEIVHNLAGNNMESIRLIWNAETEAWMALENTKVSFAVTEKAVYTVTFLPGEHGAFADNAQKKEVLVADGGAIGEVPDVNAAENYEFTGWKNSETDEIVAAEQVAATIPTGAMTFTAQYQESGSVTPPAEEKITVEFSAGADGKFADDQVTKYEISKGDQLAEVPVVTPNSKYSFAGWKVQNDTRTYTAAQILAMKFDVNTVITAAYNYTGGGSGGGGATYYTVKFEKGEHGSLLGNTSFSIRSGNRLTTVPAVDVDDGYKFAGWRSGSTTYTNEEVKNLKITKATTFTAQYKTITGNSGASDKNWSNALEKDEHFAYISGYPDGTIKPTGNITREEVASIFYRLLKDSVRTENGTESNSFSDVPSDRWSNKAVSTLASMGILSGYPDGTFRPTAPITRAEFAVVASKFDELESADAQFGDVDGHWALSYIGSAAKKGWIAGYDDNTFHPNAAILRAEAVVMTNRVLGRKVDKSGLLDSAKQWSDNLSSAWYYFDILEASNSHSFDKLEGIEKWISLTADKIWN